MNMLQVYARARTRAVTKDNIVTAWRKTGLQPLDQNAIPPDAYAPAENTTTKAALPHILLETQAPLAVTSSSSMQQISAIPHPPPPTQGSNTLLIAAISNTRHAEGVECNLNAACSTSSEIVAIPTPPPFVASTSPENPPTQAVNDSSQSLLPSTAIDACTIPSKVARSAIPIQPRHGSRPKALLNHIDSLHKLCEAMADQIEADAALKALYFEQNQSLMEKLNWKQKPKTKEYIHTGARHMTGYEGLREAGLQAQKPHFKAAFAELHKHFKAVEAAEHKAEHAAAKEAKLALKEAEKARKEQEKAEKAAAAAAEKECKQRKKEAAQHAKEEAARQKKEAQEQALATAARRHAEQATAKQAAKEAKQLVSMEAKTKRGVGRANTRARSEAIIPQAPSMPQQTFNSPAASRTTLSPSKPQQMNNNRVPKTYVKENRKRRREDQDELPTPTPKRRGVGPAERETIRIENGVVVDAEDTFWRALG
jgi:hypothetical protein